MNQHLITLPTAGEFPTYYGVYIEQVAASPLDQSLTRQPDALRAMLADCSPEQASFRYAEGKWSIREVVGHMIDCERIFAMRALCIARGEQQPLPGFDENAYVDSARFDQRSLASLVDEFAAVRAATVALYASFNEEDLQRRGTANGGTFTPHAIAWILAGHVSHHTRVLQERYNVA